MNTHRMNAPGAAAIGLLLAACSGGGADDVSGPATCSTINSAGATVESTGPATNIVNAVDGDLFSHATLALTSSAQSGSIRATAASGVTYPSGSRAGGFVSLLDQGTANATLIRTYLDGVLVETSAPGTSIFELTRGGTGADLYIGFVTTAPFDAVEFAETDNGANGTTDYRVYELCSDGQV